MGNRSPGRGCRRGGGEVGGCGGGQRAARGRNLRLGFIVPAIVETLRAGHWASEEQINICDKRKLINLMNIMLQLNNSHFIFASLLLNSWIVTDSPIPHKYAVSNLDKWKPGGTQASSARSWSHFYPFSYFSFHVNDFFSLFYNVIHLFHK